MKLSSTRLVLLAFLLFSVLSATGGILYQRSRSAEPLAFYGTAGAHRIRKAPQVNIARLERVGENSADPAAGAADTLMLEGQTWRMTDRREITRSRGLVNIRYALLDRGTYDWDATGELSTGCTPQWGYALEFREGESATVLALSFDCPRVTPDGKSITSIAPSAAAIHKFVEEQFPAAK